MNDGNVFRSLINEEYTIPNTFVIVKMNWLSMRIPVERYGRPFPQLCGSPHPQYFRPDVMWGCAPLIGVPVGLWLPKISEVRPFWRSGGFMVKNYANCECR